MTRILMVVAGLDVHQKLCSYMKPKRWIDVRTLLPHDPSHKRGEATIDSVARQAGFGEAVQTCMDAAVAHEYVAVCCTKGKHRSTTVAATARRALIQQGLAHTIITNHHPIDVRRSMSMCSRFSCIDLKSNPTAVLVSHVICLW